MQTRLAAAKLALVGDVVVDEGCGVEMLHRGRRTRGKLSRTTYRHAAQETHDGTGALATVCRVLGQGCVQVSIHVWMRTVSRVVGGDKLVYLCVVVVEEAHEVSCHQNRIS